MPRALLQAGSYGSVSVDCLKDTHGAPCTSGELVPLNVLIPVASMALVAFWLILFCALCALGNRLKRQEDHVDGGEKASPATGHAEVILDPIKSTSPAFGLQASCAAGCAKGMDPGPPPPPMKTGLVPATGMRL